MSTTVRTDVRRARIWVEEPCICAQLTPGFSLKPEWIRENAEQLRANAGPECLLCGGSGVEIVDREDPDSYVNWATANARVVFNALGIDIERREASVVEFRRALLRALNTSLAHLIQPRIVEPRFFDPGLDEEGIRRRLISLRDLVERDAALGAHVVRWDF